MDLAAFRVALEELRQILTTIEGRKIDGVRLLDEDAYRYRYLAAWPSRGIPVECYAQINPGMSLFVVRASLGVPFALALRSAASEFIQRVNYPLAIGNWAIDLESGEVRFKLGFCFGHQALTKHLMLTHIDAACHYIDERIMGFVHLHAGHSVQEALSAKA